MGLDYEKLARVKNEHFTPMTEDEERAERRERAERWCRVCGLDPARVDLFSFADVQRTPIRRLTNGELSKHGYCETDADQDKLEQSLLELWGWYVPVVWGRVSLEQIRRKWHLAVHFSIIGEITADDPEFVTMARVLRKWLLSDAAFEVRGGWGEWQSNDPEAALAMLEMVHKRSPGDHPILWVPQSTVKACRQAGASQVHQWAGTRRVQAETLLGQGGITSSAARCEFVLKDLARRMLVA